MKKAAFLDRDGVINKRAGDGGYILNWGEFEVLSGVPEAITQLNRAGFQVIVVTNQQCVAKGLITIAGLEEIHRNLQRELADAGAHLDAIYYCPHGSDESCACRKPAPGMLLTAAKEHDLDLASSWIIGDADSDIVAGQSAGCKTILITGDLHPSAGTVANSTVESLPAAVKRILAAA
ncbi:MAG TPA: HAD family hydrolase [Candidatus Acidoferrum sp.]|nr:HAD family hydrolase [Candidatus Acidoferrum sp.]